MQRHIIAWAPGDQGDAEEAAQALEKMVGVAVRKAVGADQAIEREGWHNPPLGPRYTFKMLALPGCPAVETERRLSYDPSCSGSIGVTVPKGEQDRLAREMASPEFLPHGGERMRGPAKISVTASGVFATRWRNMDDDSLRALSATLPPWGYVYRPPVGSSPPLVFNGGTALEFRKPARTG